MFLSVCIQILPFDLQACVCSNCLPGFLHQIKVQVLCYIPLSVYVMRYSLILNKEWSFSDDNGLVLPFLFIARVAVAQSSSLNLFANRDVELEQRAMLLKRLAFAIFSSEIDQYQKYLPDIQGK